MQGSIALADVSAAYYSAGTTAAAGGSPLAIGGGAGGLSALGHPDDKLGYAATIGTVINLPTAGAIRSEFRQLRQRRLGLRQDRDKVPLTLSKATALEWALSLMPFTAGLVAISS